MRLLAELQFVLPFEAFFHLKVVTIVRDKKPKENFQLGLEFDDPPSLLLLAPPTPISDHGTREVVATLETLTWISSYCETLPHYTVTSTKYVWGLGYVPSYDKLTFAITSTIGSGVRFRCVSISSTNPGEMEYRLVSS